MPWKQPGPLLELFRVVWEWLLIYGYAPALAFAIAVIRGAFAGGRPMRTFLEGVMIGLITLALVPLLQYFDLPADLSVFLGSMLAFMGVEWVRARIDAVARRYIDRIK